MDYITEMGRIPRYDDEKLRNLNKDLFCSIFDGSASGFLNDDMGHPCYRMGVNGDEKGMDATTWGEDPEDNELYQLLKTLHAEMCRRGISVDRPICLWSDFCSVAIEAYEQLRVQY